jgi:hypothetical protein
MNENALKPVYSDPSHLVILGAGASVASSLKNPEPNGKKLPSMLDFIEVVGLEDIVQSLPIEFDSENFEDVYSKLYEKDPQSDIINEIERRVSEYFISMKLPPEPTIYDYLVMSLRPKDVIATFNWDPFLYDAFWRNHTQTRLPWSIYLHGNVRIGHCVRDMRKGLVGTHCSKCKLPFTPSKLLFPITQKNYSADPYMKTEWTAFADALKHSRLVTVFGYSVPKTDVEAIRLMSEAWGTSGDRNLEQFEIIDIQAEDIVYERWAKFIYPGHYDYSTDYFDSRLGLSPRRTAEVYMHKIHPSTAEEALRNERNPVPRNFTTLEEIWTWFDPLIEAEEEASQLEDSDQ